MSISTRNSSPRTPSADKAKYFPNFMSTSVLYTMETGSVGPAAMTEGQDSMILSLLK